MTRKPVYPRKREALVGVRLSPEELATVTAVAERDGLSLPAALREGFLRHSRACPARTERSEVMTTTLSLSWDDPEKAAEFTRIRQELRDQTWIPDVDRDELMELVRESKVEDGSEGMPGA